MSAASLVLQNVAIAAVLAAVVSLVCRLRAIGPVARHALWLVVLLKLLTPPIVVLESPWAFPSIASSRGDTRLTTEQAPPSRFVASPSARGVDASPDADGRRASASDEYFPAGSSAAPSSAVTSGFALFAGLDALWWLAAIWTAGALVVLSVETIRAIRMARRISAGSEVPSALVAAVDEVRRRLALAPVRVVMLPVIRSPLVWCANPQRPVLLWPAQLPGDLSTSCTGGLITHELAHIKRRDHWVGWLELAAGVIWWWNPLFWFVRARLRENAELACDAWVIDTMPEGRRAYAEALLAVCTAGSSRLAPMPAVGVSTGSRRFLERRLVMIMQDRAPVRLSRVAALSVALVAVATFPVWAARATPQNPPTPRPSAPAILTTPLVEGSPFLETPPPIPLQTAANTPAYFSFADGQLPDDAEKLLEKFEQQQTDARKEMESRLTAQRDELVKALQTLQDSYTKAAKLDEAIAIRTQIRMLNGAGVALFGNVNQTLTGRRIALSPKMASSQYSWIAREGRPMAALAGNDPLTSIVEALRGQTDASLVVEVEGTDSKLAKVWGSDTYTDDSSIGAAAVHAGLLKPGEKGLIRVIVLPGQARYAGSERHGITTDSFGEWQGSFRLEKAGR